MKPFPRNPFDWHVPRLAKNPKRRDMRKMAMHALRRVIALAEYSVNGQAIGVPPADVAFMRAYAMTSARMWFDGAMRSARLCRSEDEIVRLIFPETFVTAQEGGAPQKN